MINHARTLLLNQATFLPQCLGDELIGTDFQPVSLPSSLTRIRSVLFGVDPDREMLNYRIHQLLQLIEQTDLQNFVLDLDSRLTYSLSNSDFLPLDVFLPQATQLSGTLGKTASFIGEPALSDNRLKYSELLLVSDSDTVSFSRNQTTADFTVQNGLSSPIDVPETNYQLRLKQPEVGDLWELVIRQRPQLELGQLLLLLRNTGSALVDLFHMDTSVGRTEPWQTFRNLFEQHYALSYQLGGAVLALIYRMEEERLR